jgi:hypothetical protein
MQKLHYVAYYDGPEHYFHTAPLWIGLCWGQTRISRPRGAPSSRNCPKAMPYNDNAQRSDRIDARHCETLGGDLALNRYAVGSRPADREVARPRDYETRLLSTAFPMSALPLTATAERTCQHLSNVPQAAVEASTRLVRSVPESRCGGRWRSVRLRARSRCAVQSGLGGSGRCSSGSIRSTE